jgi:hypothetical protein
MGDGHYLIGLHEADDGSFTARCTCGWSVQFGGEFDEADDVRTEAAKLFSNHVGRSVSFAEAVDWPDRPDRFLCVDCGVHTGDTHEYFVVLDEVWHASGAVDGMLCIGCIEARLGRMLKPEDFKAMPVNDMMTGPASFRSARLNHRLGRGNAPSGSID